MKTEYRKYIKWSTLPRIILYTGFRMEANGKTLSAVRQLVEEKDKVWKRGIVSNIHLNNIDYEYNSFNAVYKLFEVTNKRILLDNPFNVMYSRRYESRNIASFLYWIHVCRKFNNKVILVMPDIKTIDKRVRKIIGAIFIPKFWINKYGTPKLELIRIYRNKIVVYPTINARKYFKYYNTLEIQPIEKMEKNGVSE